MVHVFLPKNAVISAVKILPGKNRRKGGKKGPETSEWVRCRGERDGKVVFGFEVLETKTIPGDRNLLVGGFIKYFVILTPKIGEDEPILTNIFQRGWFNHQLV